VTNIASPSESAKSLATIQSEEAERLKKQEQEAPLAKVKSSQLKSILGVPAAANKNAGGSIWGAPTPTPTQSGSLKDIQEQEERQREEAEASRKQAATAALAQAVAATPKWGTNTAPAVASTQSKSSKSLAEIMEQEKAQLQSETKTTAPSGSPALVASSWAAKAAKGTGSTGSFNAIQSNVSSTPKSSAPVVAVSVPAKSEKRVEPEVESFWNFSDQKLSATVPVAEVKPTKPTTPKGDDSRGMPAATADWCREQLRKMNQSDDLSLIQVCYSMQSAVDIREYLADYLGSTPQVSQFATEFIQRKMSPSSSHSTSAVGANPNVPHTSASSSSSASSAPGAKSKKKPAAVKGK
jgi:hypothetical protein